MSKIVGQTGLFSLGRAADIEEEKILNLKVFEEYVTHWYITLLLSTLLKV